MEPDEAPDLLTMESELDRVDRWVHGADSANPSPPQNTPDRRRVSDNHVIALVNEVRRLRASRLALAERVREACAERVRQWLESLPNAKVSEDRTRPVGWIPKINTPDACVKFVKDTDLSKLVEGE